MNEEEFGELKGMFKAQKEYLCFRFDRLEKKDAEQDTRIEKLEKKGWKHSLAATFGGIVGGLVGVFTLKGFKF